MKKLLTILFLTLVYATAQAQYENTTIKPGMTAPELSFQDPNGKMLKLSEVNKGRVILLDFWASWCRPCRAASPQVVQLYKTYSGKKFKKAKKGFAVMSVYLDQNKDAWIEAIKADNLDWPYHISDLGGWQSSAASTYGVQFIPQAFLIGPDGKVIGWYMMAEQAEKDIQKLVE
jgi:thiol-disulfide isomerase/thioredoxin